jgi:hypothetical protein
MYPSTSRTLPILLSTIIKRKHLPSKMLERFLILKRTKMLYETEARLYIAFIKIVPAKWKFLPDVKATVYFLFIKEIHLTPPRF